MITQQTAELLMKNFSATEGEELTFDEKGDCALVSAEQRLIHIHYNAEVGQFELYGIVGQLPDDEELSAVLIRSFMSDNFMWLDSLGSTFAYEPENNFIIVQRAYNDGEALEESFAAEVRKFDTELGYWIERFAALPGELDDEKAELEGSSLIA